MTKPYGMKAELKDYPWRDLREELDLNDIHLKIENGALEVGYDREEDEAKAKEVATLYLQTHSLRMGFKVAANFNRTWKPTPAGGVAHAMALQSSVKFNDRLQATIHQATISGRARIVSQQMVDTASFTNDTLMVQKALKDPALKQAIAYFGDEVADASKPLYGVYKAIESITNHLGKQGRKKLAQLASQSESYISDLMETTQYSRHAVTQARQHLTEKECITRAKTLIEAYARTIS